MPVPAGTYPTALARQGQAIAKTWASWPLGYALLGRLVRLRALQVPVNTKLVAYGSNGGAVCRIIR